MRIVKTSNTAHLHYRKKIDPTDNTISSYQKLIELLEPYTPYTDIKEYSSFHYELWTTQGFRSAGGKPKYKRGLQFAAVIAHPKFIALYLHPLYVDKQLKLMLSENLKKHLHGESSFRFNIITEEMFVDLKEIVKRGWALYKDLNLV
jgi:hypothetical protein